jgi:hypothetical protein
VWRQVSQFGHLTRERQNFVSLRTVTRLKQCVLGSGDASALVQRVTAVSIPRASGIAPPKPVKTGSAPAHSDAAGNSAFTVELQTAIEERKPGTKDAKQDGGKPATDKKKDDLVPQAPVVALPQPIVQPQLAGAFGLPSGGVDPGAKTDSAPIQVTSDQPPPDTSALNMPLKAPTPPADAVKTDPKTQIAFALRLADLTPNREAVKPDLKTPPAFTPEDPTAQRSAIAVKDTPQPAADTKIDLPLKTIQPATSVIVAVPPREGAAPDSGAPTGGGASDQGAPRHTPPPPLTDLKSFRQAGAALEPMKTASKETPLQTSAPTLVTVAAEQPATQPSNRLTATPSVDVAAPLDLARPNPASKVTDVSVSIPVPRADSTGDDRIAIRMLQRGAEIHVSVRTPDTQLAQSLRQDLSKLATGLDQGGFRTETWRPAATTSTAQSNSNPQHESPAGNPNGDAAGSGSRSAGQGGQGEQKRRQQDERPRWVAELEQQQHQ